MKTFDELLIEINDFGRYQIIIFLLICIAGLIPPIATYIDIFLAPNIGYKCNDQINSNLTNITFNKCNYQINNTTYKCKSWKYDKMYYKTTLTEDWNMVCERSHFRTNIQSIYFIGFLLGSVVLGYLSDRFGRRPVMLLSFILILIGSIGTALGPQNSFGFVTSYVLYSLSRFLVACGTRGINETGYVLTLEMVSLRKRVLAAMGFEIFFPLGQLILVLTAYFIKDWRTLALAFIIPNVPLLSYVFILPESPRWLIQHKKTNEALSLMEKTARINKRVFDKKLWEDNVNQLTINQQKKETFFDFVKSCLKFPRQGILLITMLYNWILNNLAFYGVGLKSNDLGISPYLSFSISAFVELIAFAMTYLVIDKFGRKKIYFFFLTFAGISCVPIMFIKNLYAGVVCAMIGKFAISGSYALLRLYSNEVFPTSIRNTCMGICSTFSRFGVIIAPFINSLGDKTNFKSLPFLIYGVLCLLAAFSTFLLPETLNTELPENIADTHKLNSKKSKESVKSDK